MFAWSAWKLRGDGLGPRKFFKRFLQPRLRSNCPLGQGNGHIRVAAQEFYRHVNFGQIVVMREVDRVLRVTKILRLSVRFGPGIDGLHELECASVLQQYFHVGSRCIIEPAIS